MQAPDSLSHYRPFRHLLALDGDLDMLLDFKVNGTGLDEFDTEACLRGTANDPVFGEMSIFGCDTVAPAADVCFDPFTNQLKQTVDL